MSSPSQSVCDIVGGDADALGLVAERFVERQAAQRVEYTEASRSHLARVFPRDTVPSQLQSVDAPAATPLLARPTPPRAREKSEREARRVSRAPPPDAIGAPRGVPVYALDGSVVLRPGADRVEV